MSEIHLDKEWLHRFTVMGQVIAGSADEDCIDNKQQRI
jgi:hypothetical protein